MTRGRARRERPGEVVDRLGQRAGHHVAPGGWVFADLMQEDAGELFLAPGHA